MRIGLSKHLQISPIAYAVYLVITLMFLAFILASQLAVANISYDDQKKSLAEALFGDARMALSAKLYTEADVYFHRGVPHLKERAFDSDIFQNLHEKVSPSKHVHVSGASGIKEIMPWLELSIRANPRNLDSYLVAAFWLSSEAGRADLALKILEKAQRNIPYSYQVQLEKGRILLHSGQYNAALQAFTAALAFWNKTANRDDRGAQLDRSRALLYHGLLMEAAGKNTNAIADFRAALQITPESPAIRDRLTALQDGSTPDPPANDLLASMLKKEDKHRRECKHHHKHGHDEHEHNDNEHNGINNSHETHKD